MPDAESKDLCISCRNQFDCMGQGVFGTEECTGWDPAAAEAQGKTRAPSSVRLPQSGISINPAEGVRKA
jgi:hypothetical protein